MRSLQPGQISAQTVWMSVAADMQMRMYVGAAGNRANM
jgi:hypothetical protein